MPKMKPHSGMKDRYKVTGSGKLRFKKANKGHLMAHMKRRRVRNLDIMGQASAADAKKVKKLLGI